MNTMKLISGVFIFFLLLFGCEYVTNNDQVIDTEGITVAEDEAFSLKSAEVAEEEAQSVAFSVDLKTESSFGINDGSYFCARFFPSCATVTVSGETYPKEIIVEFGEDCVDRSGNERTGTIIINISDTIKNEGAVLTVEFDSVFFRNRLIERYMVMENLGTNDAGNWVMSIKDTATISYGDTAKSVRISSYEQEWISGFGTPQHDDDIFFKTGSGTITINEEAVFTKNIVEPLLIDRSCGYIISGIMEITKDDNVMTIDFGDGTCDSEATVTKDDSTEVIDLATCKFKGKFDREHHRSNQRYGWW